LLTFEPRTLLVFDSPLAEVLPFAPFVIGAIF
jgi:hypothetical protein